MICWVLTSRPCLAWCSGRRSGAPPRRPTGLSGPDRQRCGARPCPLLTAASEAGLVGCDVQKALCKGR